MIIHMYSGETPYTDGWTVRNLFPFILSAKKVGAQPTYHSTQIYLLPASTASATGASTREATKARAHAVRCTFHLFGLIIQ